MNVAKAFLITLAACLLGELLFWGALLVIAALVRVRATKPAAPKPAEKPGLRVVRDDGGRCS